MRPFHRLMVSMAVLVSAGSGGAQAQDLAFRARSPDGRIDFELSKSTARLAFSTYCARARNEPRCDTFEKYDIDVSVANGQIVMTFVHRDVLRGRPLPEAWHFNEAFVCPYELERFECYSGYHRQ